MEIKKEFMETFTKILNTEYFSIAELAKKMGYKTPNYLAEKVKKLGLGYRIKGVHLLSIRDKKILENNIYRRNEEEKKYIFIANNEKEDESIRRIESILVQDLNTKYSTINELSKKEGYNDDSAYLSRKAKRLGLGLRIKTTTLLSKEDQEILLSSIKRRKREDL